MNSALRRRLLLTALALAAYKLCFLVPLPTLAPDVLEFIDGVSPWAKGWSVFGLGLAPWVTGFIAVELFSLVVPRGRRVRTFGREGRQTLNRWAVRLSVVIAFFQAYAVTNSFGWMNTPNGAPVLYDSSLRRFVTVMTLLAGSAAVFGLARWISRHGLGNGFCWIFMAEIGLSWFDDPHAAGFQLHEGSFTNLLVGLGFVAVFAYLFQHPAHYRLSTARSGADIETEAVPGGEPGAASDSWAGYAAAGSPRSAGAIEAEIDPSRDGVEETRLPLPALPQGIVPLGWAYVMLGAWDLVGPYFGVAVETSGLDLAPYLAGLCLLIPILGLPTLFLFSNRRRVEAYLPHPVVVATDFESVLYRRFLATTAILVVLAVAETLFRFYTEAGFLVSLVQAAFVAAMVIDIRREWQFRERYPDAVQLVELDNVHLGLRLEGELESHGIPNAIQATRFRSLGFFLQPLYKMAVLVPSDRIEESREVWDGLGSKIV